MSLEQDFLHGYEKYSKHFDKWCEKASTILRKVTQCGIVETDNDGNALIAINRPDFGELYIDKKSYLADEHLTYSMKAIEGFKTQYSFDGVQFLQNHEEALYGKKFDLWHGFTYTEMIDNAQRQYYFGSDTPLIYDNLINNVNLVRKLIKNFKDDNKQIINYFRDRKFNISEVKEDYFNDININYKSDAEIFTANLHVLELLDKDKRITDRELQCIQLYSRGMSANKSGKMLGISRRTVETHFNNVKQKVKIDFKSELNEVLR